MFPSTSARTSAVNRPAKTIGDRRVPAYLRREPVPLQFRVPVSCTFPCPDRFVGHSPRIPRGVIEFITEPDPRRTRGSSKTPRGTECESLAVQAHEEIKLDAPRSLGRSPVRSRGSRLALLTRFSRRDCDRRHRSSNLPRVSFVPKAAGPLPTRFSRLCVPRDR